MLFAAIFGECAAPVYTRCIELHVAGAQHQIREFYEAIWPLVVEVHEQGRKAKLRLPDPSTFANQLYDRMTEAGIEIVIGPPLEAHGGSYGSGHR